MWVLVEMRQCCLVVVFFGATFSVKIVHKIYASANNNVWFTCIGKISTCGDLSERCPMEKGFTIHLGILSWDISLGNFYQD